MDDITVVGLGGITGESITRPEKRVEDSPPYR